MHETTRVRRLLRFPSMFIAAALIARKRTDKKDLSRKK